MWIKINLFVLSVILLVFAINCAHSWSYEDDYSFYTPRRRYYSSEINLEIFDRPCQCNKLKHCKVFIDILTKTNINSISPVLAHKFRQSSCGFENAEPVVCCPINFNSKRFGSKREYLPAVTTEESWVWDIEQNHPVTESGFDGYHYNNYNQFGQRNPPRIPSSSFNHIHNTGSKRNHKFYAHFEDPRSRKNCPPSFSREFELPETIDVKPVPMVPDIVSPTTTTTTTTLAPAPVSEAVSEEPEVTTQTPTEEDLRRQEKLALINSDLCGISIHTRIIGGEDSGPGQFPWMARLAYRNRTSGRVTYRCSGSVISDRYVLTAAHCVRNLIDDLEVIMVRLGELDVRSDRDCNTDQTSCTEAQDFEIERITAHSLYDTPKYANDIALIRLRTTTNSTFISPLCLPMDKFSNMAQNLAGQQGIIAGWGSMTAGSNAASPILQWVKLPIVDNQSCAASYARFSANSRTPIIVSQSQLCVQGRENMDACQGDSGGPLMSEGAAGAERYTLLGLVSFGPRTCGVSNFPGVYTRISSYSTWILDNIEM